MKQTSRPPFPPFDEEAAILKVRLAEDAWNSKDAQKVSLAYTVDSQWRNRDQFLSGRDAIQTFLERKWEKEHEYRLVKELWAYANNRIAVRFAYEWHDNNNQWYRSYGNENWEFDDIGLMRQRLASINDIAIREDERKFNWLEGRRPDDYASLSALNL